jgi:hypothetical protein
MFYSCSIFTFSCPKALSFFASNISAWNIRNVAIIYEKQTLGAKPDWIYIILSTFQNLEKLVIDIKTETDGVRDCWWDTVRNAVREGHCSMRGIGKTSMYSKCFVVSAK